MKPPDCGSSCSESRAPARARKPRACPSTTASRTSPPATCSAPPSRRARRSGSRRKRVHGRRRVRARRHRGPGGRRALRAGGPLERRVHPRRVPADAAAGGGARGGARRPPARPRDQPRRAHRDRARPHRRSPGLRELRRQLPRQHAADGDWICDICGGEVVQRDDDTEEAVDRRLEIYESQTVPIIDFYRASGSWSRSTGSATATRCSSV